MNNFETATAAIHAQAPIANQVAGQAGHVAEEAGNTVTKLGAVGESIGDFWTSVSNLKTTAEEIQAAISAAGLAEATNSAAVNASDSATGIRVVIDREIATLDGEGAANLRSLSGQFDNETTTVKDNAAHINEGINSLYNGITPIIQALGEILTKAAALTANDGPVETAKSQAATTKTNATTAQTTGLQVAEAAANFTITSVS